MREQLAKIVEQALEQLKGVGDSAALEQLRVRIMGKKGELTAILRGMGQLSPQERPAMGQLVNEARRKLEEAIESCGQRLQQAEKEARLAREAIDVTLPGRERALGSLHPMNIVLEDLLEIFRHGL